MEVTEEGQNQVDNQTEIKEYKKSGKGGAVSYEKGDLMGENEEIKTNELYIKGLI